jgi:exodeoxyribonuclease-3
VRLATWNVNSITARLPRPLDWLETPARDCLPPGAVAADAMPVEAIREPAMRSRPTARRWNGVALLSRVGLDEVTTARR